jgi:predicted deacylase
MRRTWNVKALLLLLCLALMILGGLDLYRHRHFDISIVAGPGVTRVVKLSDYAKGLKGTTADTLVFILEGKREGGKALIMANTHSNEPEGMLASIIMIENAVVDRGTLIIIPQFNHSGSRNTKSGDGYPLYFKISTSWGQKTFRMGNRDASPLDQWPDPDIYIHYPEKQPLSFIDARNTNRTWPGRPDGLLMERVTFAAMEIMRQEKVDIAVDLHGAETMFPVTNCIVAPEKSLRIATMAALTVKAREGFDSHVEPSPVGFRGLSHREIGDYAETLPFLLEVPIPFLDQPTGPKTEKLLLDGKDPFLLSLAHKKKLFVPYDESGWPISKRVGQHCSLILEILRQHAKKFADRAVEVSGVGYYFHDPARAEKSKVYPD